jgi:hypothetical protein
LGSLGVAPQESEKRMSREELDSLLNEACQLAIYFLERNREFYPFGVVLSSGGEIRHVQGHTGSEYPPSAEVISLLESALAEQAGDRDIIACAVVRDVRLKLDSSASSTDAIQVELEHESDEPVLCLVPYSFEGNTVTTGDILAQHGERRIFVARRDA